MEEFSNIVNEFEERKANNLCSEDEKEKFETFL